MYKITFSDNTEFIGGDLKDSKWNEIPKDKLISSIQYNCGGVTILLTGFESYNHLVEHSQIINPQNKLTNSDLIIKSTICGRYKNRIYLVIFDFITGKVRTEIEGFTQKQVEHIEIYSHPKSTLRYTGWKPGKFDENISPRIKTA